MILDELRHELKQHIDPHTRESGKRFFKEAVKIYGINTAFVVKTGKQYFQRIQNLEKKKIFELCEELWKSGYMEESFIACNWSYLIHKQYTPKDFDIFDRWIHTYVSNWASCDTLCNHTIGTFVEMYPEYINKLKQWSRSENRWVKRASAVTLIIPARKGLFLKDMFEIADTLLLDPDDLVQKGYGWMLKAACLTHEKEVFAYVMKNKKTMPRTALRYAIEKMPADLKKKAMAK